MQKWSDYQNSPVLKFSKRKCSTNCSDTVGIRIPDIWITDFTIASSCPVGSPLFRPPFEYRAFPWLDYFGPIEYQTSLLFRSPLYLKWAQKSGFQMLKFSVAAILLLVFVLVMWAENWASTKMVPPYEIGLINWISDEYRFWASSIMDHYFKTGEKLGFDL